VFLSADTIKKFHPLSYGSNLAGEIPGFGQELPVAYGGKGKDVKEGLTVRYTSSNGMYYQLFLSESLSYNEWLMERWRISKRTGIITC
jgi:hypothetical protein